MADDLRVRGRKEGGQEPDEKQTRRAEQADREQLERIRRKLGVNGTDAQLRAVREKVAKRRENQNRAAERKQVFERLQAETSTSRKPALDPRAEAFRQAGAHKETRGQDGLTAAQRQQVRSNPKAGPEFPCPSTPPLLPEQASEILPRFVCLFTPAQEQAQDKDPNRSQAQKSSSRQPPAPSQRAAFLQSTPQRVPHGAKPSVGAPNQHSPLASPRAQEPLRFDNRRQSQPASDPPRPQSSSGCWGSLFGSSSFNFQAFFLCFLQEMLARKEDWEGAFKKMAQAFEQMEQLVGKEQLGNIKLRQSCQKMAAWQRCMVASVTLAKAAVKLCHSPWGATGTDPTGETENTQARQERLEQLAAKFALSPTHPVLTKQRRDELSRLFKEGQPPFEGGEACTAEELEELESLLAKERISRGAAGEVAWLSLEIARRKETASSKKEAKEAQGRREAKEAVSQKGAETTQGAPEAEKAEASPDQAAEEKAASVHAEELRELEGRLKEAQQRLDKEVAQATSHPTYAQQLVAERDKLRHKARRLLMGIPAYEETMTRIAALDAAWVRSGTLPQEAFDEAAKWEVQEPLPLGSNEARLTSETQKKYLDFLVGHAQGGEPQDVQLEDKVAAGDVMRAVMKKHLKDPLPLTLAEAGANALFLSASQAMVGSPLASNDQVVTGQAVAGASQALAQARATLAGYGPAVERLMDRILEHMALMG